MVYDPARDPFDNHEMSQRPYQANPIDEMVTRKVRSCFKWSLGESRKRKLEASFTKVPNSYPYGVVPSTVSALTNQSA